MAKELNPTIAYMTRIPRSTPALASRLPMQEDELEEDYAMFLKWVQCACPPLHTFAAQLNAPPAFIVMCAEHNEWSRRLEESEYGAEVQAMEARTAQYLSTIKKEGAAKSIHQLVQRRLAQLAVSEHVDGTSGVDLKDLVAALKLLQEYERLEANLSTENIAVHQTSMGLTEDELGSMTDEEVWQLRNLLQKAKGEDR
jgi:hypothetical protein